MRYGVMLGVDYMRLEHLEVEDGAELLSTLYSLIGCDMIEIVRPHGLPDGYVMVVDEEGLLKENPSLNVLASYLYGMHERAWMTEREALDLEDKVENVIWGKAIRAIRKYYDEKAAKGDRAV